MIMIIMHKSNGRGVSGNNGGGGEQGYDTAGDVFILIKSAGSIVYSSVNVK